MSSGPPLRVLMIEDDPTDAKLILRAIGKLGRPLKHRVVADAESLAAALAKETWDLVLSDWSLPGFGALAALEQVKQAGHDLPFIIVSGTIGEETAVEAMRQGAHDYVIKDKLARLIPAIERELREAEVRAAQHKAEAVLRETAQQLRQAQKMEAVGRLAGGVAHDFNNVLSVILICAESLLDGLDQSSPMRGDLEEIRKSGRRAAALTQQLLSFSRQQLLEPAVVDVNEALANLNAMLHRILGEDVTLVFRIADSLGRVIVDPGGLEQVVVNLAVNARDAMPGGGTLTIETANVMLDQEYANAHLGVTPGPHVMFAVTDTGTGMDKATQAHIFEPFFTTKEKGRGTGLGLSTVFGIVQKSNGSIWVYSEPGHGTTFKIYLPRVDQPVASPVRPVSKVDLHGSETVLLVEDEDSVRNAARRILTRYGYQVIEARSPAIALDYCEHHPGVIHLLLSDVVMPGMSGPELAGRLLVTRPEMKVLCMSGYADDGMLRRVDWKPQFGFLQKPITTEVLARKLREVLEPRSV
jgi:two-component system, cell cycle sensor histidine kinase and response regulator CckA